MPRLGPFDTQDEARALVETWALDGVTHIYRQAVESAVEAQAELLAWGS